MRKAAYFGLSAVLLGVALAGCSDSGSNKTVDYYMEHAEERDAHVEDCINKHGNELRNAPDSCQTAQTAKSKAFFEDAIKANKAN